MAEYLIKNDAGEIINTIYAEESFVKANYSNYEVKTYNTSTPLDSKVLARFWRNNKLVESDTDPEHLPDHPKHDAWKAWRTALRDWPLAKDSDDKLLFPDTRPTKEY